MVYLKGEFGYVENLHGILGTGHRRPTSESVPVDDNSQEVYILSVLILQKEGTRPLVLTMFT